MTLSLQEQLERLDRQQQLILEQLADSNRHRFGRLSEKMETDGQIAFIEVDGTASFFNEAEAVATRVPEADDEEADPVKPSPRKRQGKRAEDLKGLPTVTIEHLMAEEQLKEVFGDSGYKRLPDEVYRRYAFAPAKVEVEEHHVAVYAGSQDNTQAPGVPVT